jgi:uncharacterized protein YbaR (Trm112 family)
MNKSNKQADMAQWAEDLVCPVCFEVLRFDELDVVCLGCGRSYPIVDEIPVLIADRATLKTT